MDVQEATNLTITEGEVRTIHNNGQLLWGRVNYNTTYNGDTTQQTYSGKNLLNIPDGTSTSDGITWVKDNGEIRGSGTLSTYTYSTMVSRIDLNLPSGTYTFSIKTSLPSPLQIEFSTRDNDEVRTNIQIPVSGRSITQNFPNGLKWTNIALVNGAIGTKYNLIIENVQFESGNQVTTFEPYVGGVPAPNPSYPQSVNVVTGEQTITVTDGDVSQTYTVDLGSIELCKIGTYQDYIYKSGNDWYVHKETITYEVNGGDQSRETYGGCYFFDPGNVIIPTSRKIYALSNEFNAHISSSSAAQWNDYPINVVAVRDRTTFAQIGLKRETSYTLNEWITWLSTNKPVVYYVLETPTDTKITDNTLIGQLNAIHDWLTRYGYTATVAGNLPIIINQTILN